jgi:ACT domain-containing protein
MRDYTIVGVHVTERVKNASEVQNVLTQHGASIRTRLGLHETQADPNAGAGPSGLILLDLVGKEEDVEALCDKLRKLHGVQVQRMFFSHPR